MPEDVRDEGERLGRLDDVGGNAGPVLRPDGKAVAVDGRDPRTRQAGRVGNDGGVPFRFFQQTIAILTSASETDGVVGAVEVAGPGGAVAPLHVHRREDEAFYVLEGDYSVYVGDDVITASPGTWVWGPRDVPHGYQVRSERGRHLSLMLPGRFEACFEEVSAIARPDADPRREMSRISAAARYGVDLLGPPAPA